MRERGISDVPTFYRVNCPIHGNVDITQEEAERQKKLGMVDYYKGLICPIDRDEGWWITGDMVIGDLRKIKEKL